MPRVNLSPSRALPRPVLLLILLSTLLSLWLACRYPLVDPDEGRNAEVAREMALDGDLVIPHLAGMPYLDKPPALFAMAAAGIRVFGHTPFAARVPSMLAALGILLLVARASRRLEPDGHARTAVALLASAPLFAVLAAYVIFDMPLAFCVTVVWTGLALECETGASASRRAAMFAAVTLGVLLKGPIMLVWALGGSASAALFVRGRAPLRWLAWLPGWLMVFGVAGGWFALALRRHPEYARYAFVEESLERMTTSSFQREQPWWFVPAVFAGGALPWSFATPWKLPRSSSSRVAAGFVVFAAVFFSLSHSKLVTYLLPAFPAFAWWAAECWQGSSRRVPRMLAAAALGAIPLIMVLGSPWIVRYADSQSGAPLARAIRASGGGTVAYVDCYSPGTDYLMGRLSTVVSDAGHLLTSNYVLRYRDSLRTRGQWRLVDRIEDAPGTRFVVERAGRRPAAIAGEAIFADRRFAAFRRDTLASH